MTNRSRILALALVALLAAGAVPAGASTLTIQFSGLDLVYDGNNIWDDGNIAWGLQDGWVDELATMSFFQDGSLLGTLSDGIAADVLIGGVGPIDAAGDHIVVNPDPNFGFDLYTDYGYGGLLLDWDSPVTIDYNGQDMTVLGSATTSSIFAQLLPAGLVLGTPVTVSFSTQIVDYQVGGPNATQGDDDRQYLSYFRSFGTGEVSGPLAVPEPVSLVTLGLGLLGGGIVSRRRRRS